MESPNREQTLVPVTDLGSPVFKYLCSLSPIKPAKQLHVAQTYSELTFPTAPVVFVSPQGLRKEGSSVKSEDPSSVVEAARPIAGIEYCGVACVESSKRLEFAHDDEVDSFQGSFKHDACTAASPASSPSNLEPYVEEYFADHMEETMYPMSSNGVRPNIDMTFKPAEDPTSEDAASSHTFFDHKSLSHPPINCVQFSFKSECTEDYHFNSENCVMTAADDLLLDNLLDGAEELGTHHGADADFPSMQENSENFVANELSFTLLGILDLDSKPDFISPFSSQSQGERTSLKENSVQHTGCPSSLKEAGALEIEHIQNSGVKLKVSAKSQRCFRRRCLDFDATKSKRKSSGLDCTTKPSDKSAIVSQCTSTLSSTQNVASMLSERAAATSDAINSTLSASGISIGMASSGVQRGNTSRSITPFHSPPSGLGLHLNSLGSRMLTSSNGVPGLGGLSTSKTIISGSLTKSTAIVISKKFESPGSSLQDSFVGHGNVKQETIGSFHSAALGGKRLLLHDFTLQPSMAEGLLESPQSPRQSPRKKRKQATPGDKPAEECKRCNCKKSKCLKLYCECFAAGLYCEDSCLCHDCHNKLRFQETVDASRELIKSRNPIAFAPKVVAISKQDETKDRPVTRHKRGCNCKKSQCLKKYCECFQAEVGCSEGCRCENCHNHYGRKDASEGVNNSEPICDSKEKEASEKEPGSLGRINSGINKDSSPLSPTSQHKLHGRSTVRLRSSGKARPVDISLSQRTNPDNADLSEPLSKASLQIDTPQCTRPIDSSIDATSLDDSWNADTLMPFGPLNQNNLNSQWDEAGEMCTLTPVPQHPLRPTPGSISTLPGEVSPLFSSQNADLSSYHKEFGVYDKPKESAERLACITHHRTSGSFAIGGKMANISYSDSDLRIPAVKPVSSPCTVANNCTASQCSQLWAADDSDMPDFLKDSDETPSPPRALASSPKQKRVTPPLQKRLPPAESSRIIGSVPGSSPGIKKGRKFILKALPPLPSLNSKSIT